MIVKIKTTENESILINTDHIISVDEYNVDLGGVAESGIKINLNGENKFIRGMSLDQFLTELHQEDPALMCSALLKKIDDLTAAIHGGCGNIARSVR